MLVDVRELNDRVEAFELLERAAPRCARHETVRHLLMARSVLDHELALKHATAAVELATTHGLMQTVASEGQEAIGAFRLDGEALFHPSAANPK